MRGLPFVLLFTAMTFVSWGAYGPALHHGTLATGNGLRSFVGVGLAYFLIAVIIPVLLLKRKPEAGQWTVNGSIYSTIAGSVGALGALGVILALVNGGKPVYVMPLVFGFAPVVNTLVTAGITGTFHQIRPIFICGIVAAALGAGGVLFFKPSKPAPDHAFAAIVPINHLFPPTMSQFQSSADSGGSGQETESTQDGVAGSENAVPDGQSEPASASNILSSENPVSDHSEVGENNGDRQDEQADASEESQLEAEQQSVPGIVLSIIMAALCWGSYGPMLHIGQSKMGGSRMRPFICVGLAYFLIAVAAPLLILNTMQQPVGSWDTLGMVWSVAAGIVGALGALGVVLAFNAGGKPYYVMPLVFGFAPVINTFISLTEAGTWSLVDMRFWASLAVVIAGAATVLITAPRPHAKPKPATV
ncbi:MAG: hypothetical protein KDB03_21695 [Planctomycetales bacterium]|nr:hypothetical protein [Planctomycetales bacterium]